MSSVPLLGLVALPADIPEHDLTHGQVGAVVEHLERDGVLNGQGVADPFGGVENLDADQVPRCVVVQDDAGLGLVAFFHKAVAQQEAEHIHFPGGATPSRLWNSTNVRSAGRNFSDPMPCRESKLCRLPAPVFVSRRVKLRRWRRGEDVSAYFTNQFTVVRPVHRVKVSRGRAKKGSGWAVTDEEIAGAGIGPWRTIVCRLREPTSRGRSSSRVDWRFLGDGEQLPSGRFAGSSKVRGKHPHASGNSRDGAGDGERRRV